MCQRRLGFLLASLTLLASCAAKREVRVAPLFADEPYWTTVVAKPEKDVLVTEGDLQRKYRPIARIFVESVGTNKSVSFERMKKEAAKIGADAVVQIKVTSRYDGQDVNYKGRDLGPRNRHTLEGLAVVFEPR
jgi:hypothetical protein